MVKEKVRIIKESPLIVLHWRNHEEGEKKLEVYKKDLLSAEIGDTFCVPDKHHCWRAVIDDELTVIYREVGSIGCVLKRYRTSDEADPDYLEDEVEYIHFEFH